MDRKNKYHSKKAADYILSSSDNVEKIKKNNIIIILFNTPINS